MKGTFYDINKESDSYTYLYILTQKKGFFKKAFYKMILKSKLPHYWFTDIWHVLEIRMKEDNLFWDEIINKPLELSIGILEINEFTPSDSKNIDCSKGHLKERLDVALDKAQKFETQYESEHGDYPNLNMPLR